MHAVIDHVQILIKAPVLRGLFLLTMQRNSVKNQQEIMWIRGRSCIAAFMACAILLLVVNACIPVL